MPGTIQLFRHNTVTGEVQVQNWTDADVIELIQCHDDMASKLHKMKWNVKELARSIVDFEVNDLEPVVEKLLGFLDELD